MFRFYKVTLILIEIDLTKHGKFECLNNINDYYQNNLLNF